MSTEKELGNRKFDDIRDISPLVRRAYNLAEKAHKGQLRRSGEPYFTHCVAVANIIYHEWGIEDEKYVAAALLHDVIEDTETTKEEIKRDFGEDVLELVEGVTKLSQGTDQETLSKVIDKSYLNPGVAVVKLADRLHNMRTLGPMKPEKQIEKAQETMKVYTRLAESLGMWQVKRELEDLSFMYLDPEGYRRIKEQIDNDPRNNPLFIAYVKSSLEQLMASNGFVGKVEITKKGYCESKKKQEKKAMKAECRPGSFEGVKDVVSFRVILNDTADCYVFLHQIHEQEGNRVDFGQTEQQIGANKATNGYQALSTTIAYKQGMTEIAMVTPEMEEFNKWGIISLIKKGEKDLSQYSLKIVFTPTGSIRFVPKEATAADLALEIGPAVLANGIGARSNGEEMEPMSTVLENGAVVEVILAQETRRAPEPGLEDYCSMLQTRAAIREMRILAERDERIEQGREMLEKILSPRGLVDLTDIEQNKFNSVLYQLGCDGYEDLMFKVGTGSMDMVILNKALDQAGITKRELGVTTIKLAGTDGEGILNMVDTWITKKNKNIHQIAHKRKGSQYELRIVVADLTRRQENELRRLLKRDGRFEVSLVV